MIIALGSLAMVAALNWQPLTLLLDTLLHWPNASVALSQCALIASAAGSCVMITSVGSERWPRDGPSNCVVAVRLCRAVVIAVTVAAFLSGAGSRRCRRRVPGAKSRHGDHLVFVADPNCCMCRWR